MAGEMQAIGQSKIFQGQETTVCEKVSGRGEDATDLTKILEGQASVDGSWEERASSKEEV